ncbi:hypothetical protein Q3G72_030916 [Acer saccharum]|nr:hypothetical protein Q3G72_030916 [Acer saccharum]
MLRFEMVRCVGEVTEIKEDKKDFHGSRESSLQCRCVLDVGATALVTEAATAIFGKASVNAVTGVMTGKRWTAFVADSKEAYDDDDEEEEEDSGCANCRLQLVVVPSSFLDRYGRCT